MKKAEIKTYEYVILVGNRPVARGKDLKKMREEAKRKYKKKKLAIKYEYPPGILIAISPIFGEIFRPLIDVEIFSEIENDWIKIKDVLADTGADISIIPRSW